jgi:hypothetical protein
VFIVQTGVEISTGCAFAWEAHALRRLVQPSIAAMWLLPLGLSFCLRLLNKLIRTPMLTPVFFVSIPPLFHLALLVLRVSPSSTGAAPWFFKAEPTPDWQLLWKLYSHATVAWDVLPSQLGTFVALTTFSLIHVPINIPSLSMTAGVVADIDQVGARAGGCGCCICCPLWLLLLRWALWCWPWVLVRWRQALLPRCCCGGRVRPRGRGLCVPRAAAPPSRRPTGCGCAPFSTGCGSLPPP